MKIERISILGCGWYGFALAKQLLALGYKVKGSTTSEAKLAILKTEGIEPFLVNFNTENNEYEASFFNCDVLFIAIPPMRKTPQLNDYAAKLNNIAAAAAKALVKQLVFVSSTGIYPDDNKVFNELTRPKPITDAGKMLLAAEEVLKNNKAFTTTILRFGGLIGPERNLAKHFAGKKEIANGLAPINLIHLTDCLGISLTILKEQAFGHIFNAVTPNYPTRAAFYTHACIVSGLQKPEFIPQLLTWKQIESTNVPAILAYKFKINNWLAWLPAND